MRNTKKLLRILCILLALTGNIYANCTNLETDRADYLNNYCFGGTVNLIVNGPLCGTCTQWSYYPNGTATGVPFATGTNTIQAVPAMYIPSAGTYQFSVSDGSTYCSVTVTVAPGLPTGGNPNYTNEPLYACQGSTYHLYATAPNSSWKFYNFQAPVGCAWSPPPFNSLPHEKISPVNDDYLTLGPSDPLTHGWTIKARGGNGCGFTALGSSFMNDRLPRPSIIPSPNNPLICPGDVVTYCPNIYGGAQPYLNSANPYTFILTSVVPAGTASGIMVGGCLQVTYFTGFASATIKLVANGATYGATTVVPCSAMDSPEQSLSVKSKPNTPIPITCIPSICGNGSYTASTPAVPGATSYEWWITSTGGCPILQYSQTAPYTTTTPTFPFTISNYSSPACDNHVTIHVVAVSQCGIKSNQRQTLIPSVPSVPPMPTGPTQNACNSQIQYSIPNVPGSTYYQWFINTIAAGTYNQIHGLIDNGTTILFYDYPTGGTSLSSYSIRVQACNSCGCSALSPAIVVTTAPVLTSPTFTPYPPSGNVCPYGNITFSWSGAGAPMDNYTWAIDGGTYIGLDPVGGTYCPPHCPTATGQNSLDIDFSANTGGMNFVTVTGNNACGVSTPYQYTPPWTYPTCRIGQWSASTSAVDSYFNIYPNPSNANNLTLDIPEMGTETSGKLIIATLEGKMVYEQTISSKETLINPSLADGIYIAKFLSPGATYVQKLHVIK